MYGLNEKAAVIVFSIILIVIITRAVLFIIGRAKTKQERLERKNPELQTRREQTKQAGLEKVKLENLLFDTVQTEEQIKQEGLEKIRLEQEQAKHEELEKIRLELEQSKNEELEKIKLELEQAKHEELEKIRLELEQAKHAELGKIKQELEQTKNEELEKIRLELEQAKYEELEKIRLEQAKLENGKEKEQTIKWELTEKKWSEIQKGDSVEKVSNILGTPTSTKREGKKEIWTYVYGLKEKRTLTFNKGFLKKMEIGENVLAKALIDLHEKEN